jgi:hypothetical protein
VFRLNKVTNTLDSPVSESPSGPLRYAVISMRGISYDPPCSDAGYRSKHGSVSPLLACLKDPHLGE